MNFRFVLRGGLAILMPLSAQATTVDSMITTLKSQPYQTSTLNEAENKALFNNYCVGDASSPEVPQPNYSNPLVKGAAQKLSSTQTEASSQLVKKALEEFDSVVENAKSSTQVLLTSTHPQVKALAQQIAQEVAKATSQTGFSKESKALSEQMSSAIVSSVGSIANPLITNLPNELTDVDYNKLLSIAKAMQAHMKIHFKGVDFNAIAQAAETLSASLAQEFGQVDNQVVSQSAAVLLAAMGTMKVEDGDYLKQQLKQLKETMEKNPNAKPGDVVIYASDVIWSWNTYAIEAKVAVPPTAAQAFTALKKQYFNGQSENGAAYLKQMNDAIAAMKKSPGVDSEQEVLYSLSSMVELLKGNSSLSAKSASALSILVTETARQSSTEVMSAVDQIVTHLQAGNKPNALSYAQSLSWRIRSLLEFPANKPLKDLYAQMEKETAKADTATVIASGKSLQELMVKQGATQEEILSGLSNFRYNLSEVKAALQPETQKLVDQLSALADQADNVSTLKSLVATETPSSKKAEHFYFYSPVAKIYRSKVPAEAPKGTVSDAHTFLTQLCGEFRDRATMIEAKLKWANNIFILPASQSQTFTIDVKKNVWAQIPATAYDPYLRLSESVWEAKREAAPRYVTIGSDTQVDNPVLGFTVCETKYMMSEYVGKEKTFDDFKAYYEGYKTYREGCSQADRKDYYNFRGDSNFKHYSPESNGMIWYSTSLARACASPTQAKPNQNGYTDEDCKKYFSRPFHYRYNAARAGLATWMFRDDRHAEKFAAQGQMVAIYPHRFPELAPLGFTFEKESTNDLFEFDTKWLQIPGAWNTPDLGFNALLGLGTPSADQYTTYRRLQDAVDRHTDWYNSGYNDKNGTIKDQAYSPFVASSYEMSESDNFTSCGTTVQCPPDGLKRWMFVFRIKPENVYNAASVLKNEPVNFDKHWFDETSFGKSHLADSEKAWDRLGSPMEEELDSVLYLINVNDAGGGHFGEEGD